MASTTGSSPEHFDTITVFGADWCPDCRRAKAVLTTAEVPFDEIDLESDVAAAGRAEAISGQRHIPVVVFPDDTFYVEPTNIELGLKLRALRDAA
jgi:glutaredoxin